jgi:hypothetical protein
MVTQEKQYGGQTMSSKYLRLFRLEMRVLK